MGGFFNSLRVLIVMSMFDRLMENNTKAELREKMYMAGRSVPRGSTKADVARMLASAEESDHRSIHDCLEDGTSIEKTRRRTGWETVSHVAVIECRECGRRGAAETMYGDQPGDVYDRGFEGAAEILADYEI